MKKQHNRFSYWFINTPKNQFKKNHFIKKMFIFAFIFLIVVVPSLYIYLGILQRKNVVIPNTINSIAWYKNKLFLFTPSYNKINKNYTIWKTLSQTSESWLIWIKLGTILFGITGIGICWCFIDNHVVFGFSLMLYLGILFNFIDCSVDGKALDYITFTSEWRWIEYTFLLPLTLIPIIIMGNIGGVYNLPDIYIALSIWFLIIYLIVYLIIKIRTGIKNLKNKSTEKLKIYYEQRALLNEPIKKPQGEILIPE